jgi:hypothetical protein
MDKPIEFIQLTSTNFEEVERFINDVPYRLRRYNSDEDFENRVNPIGIQLGFPEGTDCAYIGDYIIKCEDGYFRPVKPDEFSKWKRVISSSGSDFHVPLNLTVSIIGTFIEEVGGIYFFTGEQGQKIQASFKTDKPLVVGKKYQLKI